MSEPTILGPTKTWFYFSQYSECIRTVEVSKETGKTITIITSTYYGRKQTSRTNKIGYDRYYPTYAEAKAALIEMYERRLKSVELSEIAARTSLNRVMALPNL